MTEDEAQTKWCPFAQSRSIEQPNAAGDRIGTMFVADNHDCATTKCVASDCMAWRKTGHEYAPLPAGAAAVPHVREMGMPAGYCGLAGKP